MPMMSLIAEIYSMMGKKAFRTLRALAVKLMKIGSKPQCYLNMETLREQRKELQLLEAA
jgi:hypothetical protein